MIGRIGPVYDVAYIGTLTNTDAYRTPLIPSVETNALSVTASSLNLPGAVGTTVAQGRFLNAATATEPVCVLGAAAAQRLGIDRSLPASGSGSTACGSTSPASSTRPRLPPKLTAQC